MTIERRSVSSEEEVKGVSAPYPDIGVLRLETSNNASHEYGSGRSA